jgi:hypothetical protein
MQIENNAWFLLNGNNSHKVQCKQNGTKIIDEEDEEKPTQGRTNGKKLLAEIKLRKRYYSAFQVMEAVNQVCPEAWLKIAERLGKAETNDIESVVRCKDCKHCKDGICWTVQGLYAIVSDMDYCSKAERRDNDETNTD